MDKALNYYYNIANAIFQWLSFVSVGLSYLFSLSVYYTLGPCFHFDMLTSFCYNVLYVIGFALC